MGRQHLDFIVTEGQTLQAGELLDVLWGCRWCCYAIKFALSASQVLEADDLFYGFQVIFLEVQFLEAEQAEYGVGDALQVTVDQLQPVRLVIFFCGLLSITSLVPSLCRHIFWRWLETSTTACGILETLLLIERILRLLRSRRDLGWRFWNISDSESQPGRAPPGSGGHTSRGAAPMSSNLTLKTLEILLQERQRRCCGFWLSTGVERAPGDCLAAHGGWYHDVLNDFKF